MGQEESTQDEDAQFKELQTNEDGRTIIPIQTKKALTSTVLGYVSLNEGLWVRLSMPIYHQNIVSWNIQKGIILDKNYYPKILKEISHIKFPFLLQLTLRNNNIESIQALTYTYLPVLERLWFCQNNICIISPVRKCFFPNIRYISFNENSMNDMLRIYELRAEMLEQFFMILTRNNKDNLSNHIVWVMKLQSKKLFKMWSIVNEQLLKTVIIAKMKHKYPFLDIDQDLKLCQNQ